MNNKIIACMVVKNEVDIIEYTLEQALKWADYILVLDNNSTDGTTDVIKKMSELEQKIIFWGAMEDHLGIRSEQLSIMTIIIYVMMVIGGVD